MRIYMDEAGSFVIPNQPSSSFCAVLALIVPAAYETELFYEFLRLRDSWPIQEIEIKGSSLHEAEAAQVIEMLTRFRRNDRIRRDGRWTSHVCSD
jgi:hypothetical protein